MTDVITVVDSTLATEAQSTQVVEVGYIAQTVSSSGGNAASTVTDETTYGVGKAVGVLTAWAREDHTHGSPALGSSSGTAAAGNHNHAGAYDAAGAAAAALVTAEAYTDTSVAARLARAANLSDLANAITARANLGLGNVATRAVGTTAGTAAAGDDSRFTDGVFPLSGYGLVAASGDPVDWAGASSTISNNDRFFARIWIPADTPIKGLWTPVRTAGVWDTTSHPNQLGLFDDSGTAIDTTPDDGTLWTATGWRGGLLLGGTIAAQATGRYVYGMWICRGITGAAIPFPGNPTDTNGSWLAYGVGVTKRRCGYSSGAALPGSFDPTTFGTASGYFTMIGAS